MEANELRIGNLLMDSISGEWVKVCQLTEKQIGTEVINRNKYPLPDGWMLSAIPLTPEILGKCWFTKYQWTDAYFYKTKFGHLMIRFLDGKIYTYFTTVSVDAGGMKMKGQRWVGNANETEEIIHLHQLQNLFFCLTGEELEVKL